MRLQQTQNRIRELMSIFVYQVEGSVSMNQTDINRISEVVLIPLFAEVFGYEDLKTLNTPQQPNFPGIDLGDDTSRVAIQVTASSDNAKVKDTLRQFVKQRHYEKFDKLRYSIILDLSSI